MSTDTPVPTAQHCQRCHCYLEPDQRAPAQPWVCRCCHAIMHGADPWRAMQDEAARQEAAHQIIAAYRDAQMAHEEAMVALAADLGIRRHNRELVRPEGLTRRQWQALRDRFCSGQSQTPAFFALQDAIGVVRGAGLAEVAGLYTPPCMESDDPRVQERLDIEHEAGMDLSDDEDDA